MRLAVDAEAAEGEAVQEAVMPAGAATRQPALEWERAAASRAPARTELATGRIVDPRKRPPQRHPHERHDPPPPQRGRIGLGAPQPTMQPTSTSPQPGAGDGVRARMLDAPPPQIVTEAALQQAREKSELMQVKARYRRAMARIKQLEHMVGSG